MKHIPLTQGKFALVDDADFDWLSQRKWCAWKNKRGVYYAVTTTSRSLGPQRLVYMHGLICGALRPDHKDGDGLNNQRGNLRPATRAQNAFNRGPAADNTTGFKGVSRVKNRNLFRMQLQSGGKRLASSFHKTAEDAARAYDAAAKKFHGQFARFNFSA